MVIGRPANRMRGPSLLYPYPTSPSLSDGCHHLFVLTSHPETWPTAAVPEMAIQAAKFTPEVLLSSPRRSAGIPNCAGTHILYSV